MRSEFKQLNALLITEWDDFQTLTPEFRISSTSYSKGLKEIEKINDE